MNKERMSLSDPSMPNSMWIRQCLEDLILPQFETKNKSYANGTDEWHNIRQMAARNFPEEFEVDPWTAMARICTIVKDKHEVALARSINIPEGEDRLKDCLVYDLFRLRLKMIRDNEVKSNQRALAEFKQDFRDLIKSVTGDDISKEDAGV